MIKNLFLLLKCIKNIISIIFLIVVFYLLFNIVCKKNNIIDKSREPSLIEKIFKKNKIEIVKLNSKQNKVVEKLIDCREEREDCKLNQEEIDLIIKLIWYKKNMLLKKTKYAVKENKNIEKKIKI